MTETSEGETKPESPLIVKFKKSLGAASKRMPALSNARHERVAQEKARGDTTNVQAYAAAGYAEQRSNAARLIASDSVQSRVAELQAEAAKVMSMTRADILAQMQRITLAAMADGSHAAALRGTELIGKEVDAMFTERREIKNVQDVDFAKLSPEEMRAKIAALMADLGIDKPPSE